MRSDKKQPEANLDKAIEEIRRQPIEQAAMKSAADRVWSRIAGELESQAGETIRGCADFQALIPEYRAGKLSPQRALLVKDHLHECVACRKEFMKQSAPPEAVQRQPRRGVRVPKWAVAAAVMLAAGVSSWQLFNRFGPPPAGPVAVVQSVNGTLFRVASEKITPVAPGEELAAGEWIRAAREASAIVRLRDGSLVELRERSAVAVSETRRDVTIRLARGSVIVEAAKRSSGHLYVSTRDCRVAVTGTVFSVNSGVKGSRISVIEGEVRVAQGGREAVLHPGEQYSTSPNMTPVSVQEEVSWSQNAAAHLALLKELAVLGDAMGRQVHLPAARYSSRLPNYLPASTALYIAIPNLGETLAAAHEVFQQRIQESPVLHEWWEEQVRAKPSGPSVEEIIDRMRRFGAYLGDEIVITAALDADGKLGPPALVAEVKQSGFPEFVKAELGASGDAELNVFESAAAITPGADKAMLLYARDGVAAMSPDATVLRQIAEAMEGRATGGFAGSPFHNQIAEAT